MELILASGSPRRRELLAQVGLRRFTVHPADIEEVVEPGLGPHETVLELSRQKAAAVCADFPRDLVLAADTVVALDGRILGKPKDPADARAMLRALSGRTHRVYTGFTLQSGDRVRSHVEVTEVTFRSLSEEEIAAYVDSGEPMDKAGAYGIQALGALLVEGIRGDYFNVMGLPVCRVALALREFGLDLLHGEEAPA